MAEKISNSPIRQLIKIKAERFFSKLIQSQDQMIEQIRNDFEQNIKDIESKYSRSKSKDLKSQDHIDIKKSPLVAKFFQKFQKNIDLLNEIKKINKQTITDFKQQESLNLTIKPLTDEKDIEFPDISSFETIESLKSKINDIMGIPNNLQNLHFNNQLLPDKSTLYQCSINSNSRLHLSYKLKGGSQIFIVLPNKKTITIDCQGQSKIQKVIQKVLQKQEQVFYKAPKSSIIVLKQDKQGKFYQLDPNATLIQQDIKAEQHLIIKIKQKRSEIYLVHQNGKTITIPYDGGIKVSNLKAIQQDIHLRNVDNKVIGDTKLQCMKVLIHKGKELEDRSTLAQENVKNSQSIFLRNKMVTIFLKLKIKNWSKETLIIDLRVQRNDRIQDLKEKIIKKLMKKLNITVALRDIKIKKLLKDKYNLDDLIEINAKQAYFEVAIDKHQEGVFDIKPRNAIPIPQIQILPQQENEAKEQENAPQQEEGDLKLDETNDPEQSEENNDQIEIQNKSEETDQKGDQLEDQ